MRIDISQTIATSLDWLVANWEVQPSLEDAAAHVGMEPTAYQKAFSAHVGLSPKRFVQALTHQHARDLLVEGVSTLDAAYAAGLSGNGRLHDLFVSVEAATPGEVKAKGRGMTIAYGFAPTPYGEMIAARTPRGLCYLGFRVDDSREHTLRNIFAAWPLATLVHDDAAVEADCAAVTAICGGQPPKGRKLALHLFGTNFQMQVWRALLKIPSGYFTSYEGVAEGIGSPQACRAVGSAVGANPICLLIPCHRVIQKTGVLGHYSSGPARKKALLGIEGYANKDG
ncbi:MAG: bifunctional helix-turn-helix domain-containing protein/methylated-DNA--[protein]-cysteine S-methyltransferase [Alphaproteobacteria bacterium]|nr:bifunctional helix-turn-helix domain-containing protein/methylated-DNA--[protein]-cysteine S-methyltransferase [Alphaproteobacteria bacterium]